MMKGSLSFFRGNSWGASKVAPAKESGGVSASLAQGGRRHAVVDLLQGSLAIGFTPMALALAWKLISEIADSSGRQ
jgi:hypothetical protein